MSDVQSELRKHTSDQLAVVSHVLEAVERQREDENVKANLDANQVIIEVERVLKAQVAALEGMVDAAGSDVEATIKKAVTDALGFAAGLYDKVREHTVSRMLRDDYTALSLVAMGYTAYHAFGLVVKDSRVADLALNHLKQITPLLVRISQVLPIVVAEEVAQNQDMHFDRSVGEQAVTNTQSAWQGTASMA